MTAHELRYAFAIRLWQMVPEIMEAWVRDVEPYFLRLFDSDVMLEEANTIARKAFDDASMRWAETHGFPGRAWDWLWYWIANAAPVREDPEARSRDVRSLLLSRRPAPNESEICIPVWWFTDLESRTEVRDRFDVMAREQFAEWAERVVDDARRRGHEPMEYRQNHPSAAQREHIDWLIERYVKGRTWGSLAQQHKHPQTTIRRAVERLESELCNPLP